jgi:hypothetical protein
MKSTALLLRPTNYTLRYSLPERIAYRSGADGIRQSVK